MDPFLPGEIPVMVLRYLAANKCETAAMALIEEMPLVKAAVPPKPAKLSISEYLKYIGRSSVSPGLKDLLTDYGNSKILAEEMLDSDNDISIMPSLPSESLLSKLKTIHELLQASLGQTQSSSISSEIRETKHPPVLRIDQFTNTDEIYECQKCISNRLVSFAQSGCQTEELSLETRHPPVLQMDQVTNTDESYECQKCMSNRLVSFTQSGCQTEELTAVQFGLHNEIPIIFYNTLLNDNNLQQKLAETINVHIQDPESGPCRPETVDTFLADFFRDDSNGITVSDLELPLGVDNDFPNRTYEEVEHNMKLMFGEVGNLNEQNTTPGNIAPFSGGDNVLNTSKEIAATVQLSQRPSDSPLGIGADKISKDVVRAGEDSPSLPSTPSNSRRSSCIKRITPTPIPSAVNPVFTSSTTVEKQTVDFGDKQSQISIIKTDIETDRWSNLKRKQIQPKIPGQTPSLPPVQKTRVIQKDSTDKVMSLGGHTKTPVPVPDSSLKVQNVVSGGTNTTSSNESITSIRDTKSVNAKPLGSPKKRKTVTPVKLTPEEAKKHSFILKNDKGSATQKAESTQMDNGTSSITTSPSLPSLPSASEESSQSLPVVTPMQASHEIDLISAGLKTISPTSLKELITSTDKVPNSSSQLANFINRKKSFSTPRKRKHVRNLNFATPPNLKAFLAGIDNRQPSSSSGPQSSLKRKSNSINDDDTHGTEFRSKKRLSWSSSKQKDECSNVKSDVAVGGSQGTKVLEQKPIFEPVTPKSDSVPKSSSVTVSAVRAVQSMPTIMEESLSNVSVAVDGVPEGQQIREPATPQIAPKPYNLEPDSKQNEYPSIHLQSPAGETSVQPQILILRTYHSDGTYVDEPCQVLDDGSLLPVRLISSTLPEGSSSQSSTTSTPATVTGNSQESVNGTTNVNAPVPPDQISDPDANLPQPMDVSEHAIQESGRKSRNRKEKEKSKKPKIRFPKKSKTNLSKEQIFGITPIKSEKDCETGSSNTIEKSSKTAKLSADAIAARSVASEAIPLGSPRRSPRKHPTKMPAPPIVQTETPTGKIVAPFAHAGQTESVSPPVTEQQPLSKRVTKQQQQENTSFNIVPAPLGFPDPTPVKNFPGNTLISASDFNGINSPLITPLKFGLPANMNETQLTLPPTPRMLEDCDSNSNSTHSLRLHFDGMIPINLLTSTPMKPGPPRTPGRSSGSSNSHSPILPESGRTQERPPTLHFLQPQPPPSTVPSNYPQQRSQLPPPTTMYLSFPQEHSQAPPPPTLSSNFPQQQHQPLSSTLPSNYPHQRSQPPPPTTVYLNFSQQQPQVALPSSFPQQEPQAPSRLQSGFPQHQPQAPPSTTVHSSFPQHDSQSMPTTLPSRFQQKFQPSSTSSLPQLTPHPSSTLSSNSSQHKHNLSSSTIAPSITKQKPQPPPSKSPETIPKHKLHPPTSKPEENPEKHGNTQVAVAQMANKIAPVQPQYEDVSPTKNDFQDDDKSDGEITSSDEQDNSQPPVQAARLAVPSKPSRNIPKLVPSTSSPALTIISSSTKDLTSARQLPAKKQEIETDQSRPESAIHSKPKPQVLISVSPNIRQTSGINFQVGQKGIKSLTLSEEVTLASLLELKNGDALRSSSQETKKELPNLPVGTASAPVVSQPQPIENKPQNPTPDLHSQARKMIGKINIRDLIRVARRAPQQQPKNT